MKYILLILMFVSTHLYSARYAEAVDWDYEKGGWICDTKTYATREEVCNSYKSFYLDWWGLKDIQICEGKEYCGSISIDDDYLDCDYLTLPICTPTVIEKRCFSNQKLVNKPIVGEVCECIDPDDVLTHTAQCVKKTCLNSAIPAINCLKEDVINALSEFGDLISPAFDQYDQSFKTAINQLDSEHPSSDPQNNDNPNQNVDLNQFNADLPVVNAKVEPYSFLSNLFPTSVSCPNDNTLSLMGDSYTFSYSKLCNALRLIGNLVMLIAIYLSFKIIRNV